MKTGSALVVKVPQNGVYAASRGGYRARLDVLDGSSTAVQRDLRRGGLAGFEPPTQATLLTIVEVAEDPVVVLDVGAHIGLYSALIATIRPTARVFAIEPASKTASLARCLRDANGLEYDVVEAAVGSEEGTATLYLSDTAETSNSLNPDFRVARGTETVRLTTLDALCAERDLSPTLIKIDVETLEAEVLAGAVGVLRRDRPWIVCELLEGTVHLDEVVRNLVDTGYVAYQLDPHLQWQAWDQDAGRDPSVRDWLFAPQPLDGPFREATRRWARAIGSCGADSNTFTPAADAVVHAKPAPDAEPAADRPRTLDDVPGWLNHTDALVFGWVLEWQTATGLSGDLVELGAFEGKTAIYLGRHLQPDERLVACDLFELVVDEPSVRPGVRSAYGALTQEAFERNWLSFHDALPTIVRGLTDTVVDVVPPASCRLVHIDASHTYQHVRSDTRTARTLLRPDGVVVFGDYRTEHSIGSSAAVWEAIVADDLHPICATGTRLFATWADPVALQGELRTRLEGRVDMHLDEQDVLGRPLLRVVRQRSTGVKPPPVELSTRPDAAAAPSSRPSPEVEARAAEVAMRSEALRLRLGATGRTTTRSAVATTRRSSRRSQWKRIAVSLTPPILLDAVRRWRATIDDD